MKLILAFLLPILFLFSCKNKYDCTAEGRVVEAVTGNPIEGATVRLQDGVSYAGQFGAGPSGTDKRAEVLTDANGYFKLSIHDGKFSPFISAGKDGYGGFNNGTEQLLSISAGKNNNNLVFHLESYGEIFPILKNRNTENFNDSLIVTLLHYKDKSYRVGINKWGGDLHVGKGPFKFISIFYTLEGNRYHPYRIKYKPSGGNWIEYMDSLFVKPFDTLRDTIYYPKF